MNDIDEREIIEQNGRSFDDWARMLGQTSMRGTGDRVEVMNGRWEPCWLRGEIEFRTGLLIGQQYRIVGIERVPEPIAVGDPVWHGSGAWRVIGLHDEPGGAKAWLYAAEDPSLSGIYRVARVDECERLSGVPVGGNR